MVEYPAHKKAKLRIGTMFAQSHKVEYEKELPCATEQGERNYIVDLLLTPKVEVMAGPTTSVTLEAPFIVEIDSTKPGQGHYSASDHAKMELRDRTFRAQGKKTARLQTAWCVGRRALSDADLMAEINWQLSK